MTRINKNANGIDKDDRNDTVIDEEMCHTEKSIDRVDPIEARNSKILKRAIFAVVILMVLCVISTLVVLRSVGNHKNSQNGTTIDENESNGSYGAVDLIAQDSIYIPPPPGLDLEGTTTSTAVPENETENDNGHDVVESIAQDSVYIPPSGNVSTLESTIEDEIYNGD